MASAFIEAAIKSNKVTIFSWTYCPYCVQVKKLFDNLNVPYESIELNNLKDGEDIRNELGRITGAKSVPRVFINGRFIGGCDDTTALHKRGGLLPLLNE